MEVIEVHSNSNISSVGAAIEHAVRKEGRAQSQGVEAEAVYQMVKATILAKWRLAKEDVDIIIKPDYVMVEINGQERLAVGFTVHSTLDPAVFKQSENKSFLYPADFRQRENKMMEDKIDVDFDARQNLASEQTEDNELLQKIEKHNAESPVLSGGDVDAAWDQAGVGEETVGGTVSTPDQDVVDELGAAVGLNYEDDEPLNTKKKLEERDRHRWELDPDSATNQSEI